MHPSLIKRKFPIRLSSNHPLTSLCWCCVYCFYVRLLFFWRERIIFACNLWINCYTNRSMHQIWIWELRKIDIIEISFLKNFWSTITNLSQKEKKKEDSTLISQFCWFEFVLIVVYMFVVVAELLSNYLKRKEIVTEFARRWERM